MLNSWSSPPFNISQAKVFPYVTKVKPNVTAVWPLCLHLVHKHSFRCYVRRDEETHHSFHRIAWLRCTGKGTVVHGWCNFARRSCNKYGGIMTCTQWHGKRENPTVDERVTVGRKALCILFGRSRFQTRWWVILTSSWGTSVSPTLNRISTLYQPTTFLLHLSAA